MKQAAKFCRCIKSVRKTLKARKGSTKERGAIAVCVKSILQTRGRTIKKFKCGKKPRLTTQKRKRTGGGMLTPERLRRLREKVLDGQTTREELAKIAKSVAGDTTDELLQDTFNDYADALSKDIPAAEIAQTRQRMTLGLAQVEMAMMRGGGKLKDQAARLEKLLADVKDEDTSKDELKSIAQEVANEHGSNDKAFKIRLEGCVRDLGDPDLSEEDLKAVRELIEETIDSLLHRVKMFIGMFPHH